MRSEKDLGTELLEREDSVKAQARTAELTKVSVQRYTEQHSPDLVVDIAEIRQAYPALPLLAEIAEKSTSYPTLLCRKLIPLRIELPLKTHVYKTLRESGENSSPG